MGVATAVSRDVPISAIPTNSKIIDLTGQVFGRLSVRGFSGLSRGGRALWVCDCGCGNTTIARSSALRRGHKESCGCLLKLVNGVLNRTHGEGHPKERSAEYRAWCGMRDRCGNPSDRHYPDYGGRGIRVCGPWKAGDGSKSGFECFLRDMGRRPSPAHSIDRYPNTDGNYEPGNCRWATAKEQQRNRRVTVKVQYRGEKIALAALCEERSLPFNVAYNRLRAGRNIEQVLAPVRRS